MIRHQTDCNGVDFYDVAVHPDFRRSGIGTRLMENLMIGQSTNQ